MATAGTLGSDRYARLRLDHGRNVEVIERICHHWVEAVEQGDLETPRVFDLVQADIAPLHARGVDTYVLGCTHFPFLLPMIRRIVGEQVHLIDPGVAVIDQLRRRIGISKAPARRSSLRGFSSGPVARFDTHLRALLGLEGNSRPLGT